MLSNKKIMKLNGRRKSLDYREIFDIFKKGVTEENNNLNRQTKQKKDIGYNLIFKTNEGNAGIFKRAQKYRNRKIYVLNEESGEISKNREVFEGDLNLLSKPSNKTRKKIADDLIFKKTKDMKQKLRTELKNFRSIKRKVIKQINELDTFGMTKNNFIDITKNSKNEIKTFSNLLDFYKTTKKFEISKTKMNLKKIEPNTKIPEISKTNILIPSLNKIYSRNKEVKFIKSISFNNTSNLSDIKKEPNLKNYLFNSEIKININNQQNQSNQLNSSSHKYNITKSNFSKKLILKSNVLSRFDFLSRNKRLAGCNNTTSFTLEINKLK